MRIRCILYGCRLHSVPGQQVRIYGTIQYIGLTVIDCRLHCKTSILVFPANVLVASLTARLCKIRRRPVLPNELIAPETHLLH